MTEPVIGKLARALRSGGVYSAWIGINDAQIAENLAREDFDAVTLDMQHGSVDLVGAARAILSVALQANRPWYASASAISPPPAASPMRALRGSSRR